MSNGASNETIAAYADNLIALEAERDAAQGRIKDVYGNARETYGKRFADSLKLAIKRHRMDADKRDAADEVDADAERMVGIINSPRAPRATRSANTVPEHDADGVIIETTVPRHEAVEAGESITAISPADIPEPAEEVPPTLTSAAPGGESAVPAAALAVADQNARVDADAGVGRSGGGASLPLNNAPAPAANVIALRTHNPETHFLNSEGLPRLHGCLKPDACAGSWRGLCSRCAPHAAQRGDAA